MGDRILSTTFSDKNVNHFYETSKELKHFLHHNDAFVTKLIQVTNEIKRIFTCKLHMNFDYRIQSLLGCIKYNLNLVIHSFTRLFKKKYKH